MGASVLSIAAMILFSVAFEDDFRVESAGPTTYTWGVEPPAVKRAMARLDQANRLREMAAPLEAHGSTARAAKFRRLAADAYLAFEGLYPDGEKEVPRTLAVSAARYARARLGGGDEAALAAIAAEFPEEPAGLLAELALLRGRVERGEGGVEPRLEKLEFALRRRGASGLEQAVAAMARQVQAQRRVTIERWTGASLSVRDGQAEALYLRGRLAEAAGRTDEAAERYGDVLRAGGEEWDARERLARLKPSAGRPGETINIKRSTP
jgi:tetratricopeptide (TPR) repeat protein